MKSTLRTYKPKRGRPPKASNLSSAQQSPPLSLSNASPVFSTNYNTTPVPTVNQIVHPLQEKPSGQSVVNACKEYESSLLETEQASLLTAMNAGVSMHDLSLHAVHNYASAIYFNKSVQLALLTRMKYLTTLLSRLCFECNSTDFLREVLFGRILCPEHGALRDHFRDMVVVALNSMHSSIGGKVGLSARPEVKVELEKPIDLTDSDSDQTFDYFTSNKN